MNHTRFKHHFSAFSLLELLIIAAIVAVIAAFSIPGYTNYVTKTRVNSLWQQAEAAKLAVESIYLKKNTAIDQITVDSGAAEYTTSTTDFVKCVTIQDGIVSVVGKPTSFNNLSIWIAMEPTVTLGQLAWGCVYSTDAAAYVTDISGTCAACTPVSGSCVQPFANDAACT